MLTKASTKEKEFLLVLDCAGSKMVAGLWSYVRQEVVAFTCKDQSFGQAADFMPLIKDFMVKHHIRFDDLKGIAVTQGPGGFTGIRVALATARALRIALSIPLLGVSSLQAHRLAITTRSPVLVLLDSRRKDFFTQEFDTYGQAVSEPEILDLGDVEERLVQSPEIKVAGDCLELLSNISIQRFCHPVTGVKPADFIGGFAKLNLPAFGSPPPGPLYCRAPEISQPKFH